VELQHTYLDFYEISFFFFHEPHAIWGSFYTRYARIALHLLSPCVLGLHIHCMGKGKDRNGRPRHWRPDELQGKVGKCFLSDGKVEPTVSGKIILAGGSGIFPENLAFPEAFAARPP